MGISHRKQTIISQLLLTIIPISTVDFEWREKDTLTSQYGSSLKQ